MKERVTPDNITDLGEDEIFVFGSNESGIHGAGAAKTALSFGAQIGVGFGHKGQTFAIPTKDWRVGKLDIKYIKSYVERFIDYAALMKPYIFLVTEIGCGLAGYTPKEIAPLFKKAKDIPNIYLPEKFWKYYN